MNNALKFQNFIFSLVGKIFTYAELQRIEEFGECPDEIHSYLEMRQGSVLSTNDFDTIKSLLPNSAQDACDTPIGISIGGFILSDDGSISFSDDQVDSILDIWDQLNTSTIHTTTRCSVTGPMDV